MKLISSRRGCSPEILSKQAGGILAVTFGLAALAACHKSAPLPPAAGNAGLMKSASLLIGALSNNTASVVRLYPGADGLVGVIFENPSGSMRIVWMTPHGVAIVPGPVITAAGQDMTGLAQQAIDAVSKTLPAKPSGFPGEIGGATGERGQNTSPSPAPSVSSGAQGKKMSADDFLLMSRHLKSIALGRGRREVWIYFDPNCIFCNRLWEEMKPYGKVVTAHWIPVGFLKKDDSLKKATGILQSKDPARALVENEDRFDTGSEEGGFPIPSAIDVASERAVATSTIGLGQATGELATPTLVFRGTDGNPHSVMGLPEDLTKFLSGVKN